MRIQAVFLVILGCNGDEALKVFNSEPTAEITSHYDGETLLEGATINFRGSVSDPNHQNPELSVSWYLDDEAICSAIAPSVDGETTCEIRPQLQSQKIILEARDPEGAAATHTLTFNVTPTDAPNIELLSPLEENQYYSDYLIPFRAIISDNEDLPEELTSIWESSLDGVLDVNTTPQSSGEIEGFSLLSAGQHVISLLVEDTYGKTTSENVIISVGGPNTVPTCSITAPLDNFVSQVGENIEFSGQVSDPDIAVNELSISWASDQDGLLGTGTVNSSGVTALNHTDLSIGVHNITLTVVDDAGAECATFITGTVGSPPVGLRAGRQFYQVEVAA